MNNPAELAPAKGSASRMRELRKRQSAMKRRIELQVYHSVYDLLKEIATRENTDYSTLISTLIAHYSVRLNYDEVDKDLRQLQFNAVSDINTLDLTKR